MQAVIVKIHTAFGHHLGHIWALLHTLRETENVEFRKMPGLKRPITNLAII